MINVYPKEKDFLKNIKKKKNQLFWSTFKSDLDTPVSTYLRPNSPPEINFSPIIGYTKSKKTNKYFFNFGDTKKDAPTSKNNIIKAELIRHCSVSGYIP